jgi:hypothetical protein
VQDILPLLGSSLFAARPDDLARVKATPKTDGWVHPIKIINSRSFKKPSKRLKSDCARKRRMRGISEIQDRDYREDRLLAKRACFFFGLSRVFASPLALIILC